MTDARAWIDRFREQLRSARRLDESEVDRLVAEAEARCAALERSGHEVFGSPEQHARQVLRERAPRPIDTAREHAPLAGLAAGAALVAIAVGLVLADAAWSVVPGVCGVMLLGVSLQAHLVRRRRRASTGEGAAPVDRWTWRLEGVLVGRHGMPRILARRRARDARAHLTGTKDPEEELGPAEQYAEKIGAAGRDNFGWLRLEITGGVVAAFQFASFLLDVGPQPNGWQTWSSLGIGMVCAAVSVWAYHRDQVRRQPR